MIKGFNRLIKPETPSTVPPEVKPQAERKEEKAPVFEPVIVKGKDVPLPELPKKKPWGKSKERDEKNPNRKKSALTEIAIHTPKISLNYCATKSVVKPVIDGMKNALLSKGILSIPHFGRFYIARKNVTKYIGSKEKKVIFTIKFRPSIFFKAQMEKVWNQKAEIQITPPEEEENSSLSQKQTLTTDSVLSVDGEEYQE